jgi:hypothetical protein
MGFATIGKVQEKVGSDEILCPRGKQILQKKLPLTSIFPKLVQNSSWSKIYCEFRMFKAQICSLLHFLFDQLGIQLWHFEFLLK